MIQTANARRTQNCALVALAHAKNEARKEMHRAAAAGPGRSPANALAYAQARKAYSAACGAYDSALLEL